MYVKKPLQLPTNNNIPKHFLDALTKKIMSNPVLVSINDSLLIVDESSLPSNYKGEKIPQDQLKTDITNWQNKDSSKKSKSIPKPDYTLKIILMGDGGVGKTALISRYCHGTFSKHYKSTHGADFVTIYRPLENGQTVEVHIWDPGTHQQFSDLGTYYYRGADAFIIVADSNIAKTFEHAESYLEEITGTEVTTALILNKLDVENRAVSTKRAQAFANTHNMLYMETSCKENIKVEEIFDQVIENALAKTIQKRTQKEIQDAPRKELLQQVEQNIEVLNNYLQSQINRSGLNLSTKKDLFLTKSKDLSSNYDQSAQWKNSIDTVWTKNENLKKLIKEVKEIAGAHRENKSSAPLTWFFKFNWLRNTTSLNEFEKVFDSDNNAKPSAVLKK